MLSLLPGRSGIRPMGPSPSPNYQIARVEITSAGFDSRSRDLCRFQVKSLCDTLNDFFMNLGEPGTIGVELLRPRHLTRPGIDHLRVQPNLFVVSPNSACEDIANVELTSDLLHIDGVALVAEGRVARDHQAPGNPREVGGESLGDSVGEILLVGI